MVYVGWLSDQKPRKQRRWNLPCTSLEALEFEVPKAQLLKNTVPLVYITRTIIYINHLSQEE